VCWYNLNIGKTGFTSNKLSCFSSKQTEKPVSSHKELLAHMKRFLPLFFLFSVACTSTKFIDHAESNTANIQLPWKKVLVVSVMPEQYDSAAARTERTMLEVLTQKGIPAATSTSLYGNRAAQQMGRDNFTQRITNDGFDGVLVIHLTNVEKQANYDKGSSFVTPNYYRNYMEFTGQLYKNVYESPGKGFQFSNLYSVETNFYSLADKQLKYTAGSKATDPDNRAVADYCNALVKDMQKRKII
jgi:hypothetical protein